MSLSDQCLGVTEEEGGVYEKRSNGVVLQSQLYHSLSYVSQLFYDRNCIMGEAAHIGTWDYKFVCFSRFLTS